MRAHYHLLFRFQNPLKAPLESQKRLTQYNFRGNDLFKEHGLILSQP